jgi:hypothetical protein
MVHNEDGHFVGRKHLTSDVAAESVELVAG